MLTHGVDELLALADRCTCTGQGIVQGWRVDEWILDDDAVDAALAVYEAVLVGDLEAETQAALEAVGVPVRELLLDAEHDREEVTRSDLTELVATASLVSDGWPVGRLLLPNVPKMSRRKSESGIDVVASSLLDDGPVDELLPGEHLYLASVKHTTAGGTGGLRYALDRSVTDEWTPVYVATQLRVLAGRLRMAVPDARATRLYLFLEGFPDFSRTVIHALGVVDVEQRADFDQQMSNLRPVAIDTYQMRAISIEGLASIHERCA